MADNPRSRRYTFEQFAPVRRYQPRLTFSPDGEHVAYSCNASGQFNLWRQPATGSEAVRLIHFDEQAVRDVAWAPDGSTLLFTADH
jgi:Tol biopolymer transport system component